MNEWRFIAFAAFAVCMWCSLGMFFAFPHAVFLAGYFIGASGMVVLPLFDWLHAKYRRKP